jgi:hypothetical protein
MFVAECLIRRASIASISAFFAMKAARAASRFRRAVSLRSWLRADCVRRWVVMAAVPSGASFW